MSELKKASEKSTEENVLSLLTALVAWFFMPFLCMKGWDAIAYNFNLPVFGYWQWVCIVRGLRYIIHR